MSSKIKLNALSTPMVMALPCIFQLIFPRRPTQQELNNSRMDAMEHLTSDLSLISDWGQANLVLLNTSKT